MALTVTANWLEAFSKDTVEPVYLVTIFDGTTTWRAINDRSDILTTDDIGVNTVAPVGVTLDPLERNVQIGSTTIAFRDEWLRPILFANNLIGQQVTIKLGARELAEADFIDFFAGAIATDGIKPDMLGHMINVEVISNLEQVLTTEIVGYWIRAHPIEVLYRPAETSAVTYTGSGLNDLTLGGTYTDDVEKPYLVRIDGTGTPDTFRYSHDFGVTWEATGIAMTGAAQSIGDGLTVTWGATTGHTLNDIWTWHATAADGVFTKTQVPVAQLNTSEFDPSTAAFADFGHFVVSLGGNFGSGWNEDAIREPEPAGNVISEISRLMMGNVVVQEDGKIGYKVYDSSAATVAHWTDTQIKDVQYDGITIINRVDVMTRQQGTGGPYWERWRAEDTASQAKFAHPDGTSRVYEHKIESRWLNKNAFVDQLLFADTAFTLNRRAFPMGMCGTRRFEQSGGQPTWARLSASKPAYLVFHELGDNGHYSGPREVVSCDTALTWAGDISARFLTEDPVTGALTNTRRFSIDLVYSGITRGEFGSTQQSMGGGSQGIFVVDTTIPVFVSQEILKRHKNGAHKLTVTTNFTTFAAQLGDFVSLDWAEFVAEGLDGLDSSTKFEVIGKQPDPDAPEPVITWTLYQVVDDALTEANEQRVTPFSGFTGYSRIESTGDGHVKEGHTVTADVGFQAIIDAGSVGNFNQETTTQKDQGEVFAASTETWVYRDAESGIFRYIEQTLGTGQPPDQINQILIAQVDTDGSGITTIDNNVRQTTALDGVKLNDETVDTLQIAVAAVNTRQMDERKKSGRNLGPNGDFSQASRG